MLRPHHGPTGPAAEYREEGNFPLFHVFCFYFTFFLYKYYSTTYETNTYHLNISIDTPEEYLTNQRIDLCRGGDLQILLSPHFQQRPFRQFSGVTTMLSNPFTPLQDTQRPENVEAKSI
jgi:hypothetical protein